LKLDDVDDEYVFTLHLGRQPFTSTARHDNTGENILLNKREVVNYKTFQYENFNLLILSSRKYAGVLFASLITRL